MTIYFYNITEKYGCFSNFSRHPIELDGEVWPTSEHYFQAQKFVGTSHAEDVRRAPTPKEAAAIGRDRSRPMRVDWEEVKDEIMRRAVMQKFLSHPDICEILLSTKDEMLVEQTTDDYYWGVGTRGGGINMLGLILMEVRGKIRASRRNKK